MDPSLALIYVNQRSQRLDAETERYWSARRTDSTRPGRNSWTWPRRIVWRRRPYEGMPTPAIRSMSTGAAQVG